jgi:5-amino-6-(5-phosphoribosylamino)uracil reductase
MSPDAPYVLLSCAVSADGYLDDATGTRLILSGPADLDRVDEVRASCDAIMVGAGTIRRDNPRLLIRDPRRRALRVARGRPEHPLRVALTASGDLDPASNFFASHSPFVVYQGSQLSLRDVLASLASERQVLRVMVEGGASVLGAFLAQDLAHELHLAIAPVFVADTRAPRFSLPAPPASGAPTLAGAERLDDVVVLRYLLGPGGADQRFLRWAIELSRQCPPSRNAFSVGAVLVSASGEVIATGYSREQEEADHAEEVALRKAGLDKRLSQATLYTSLIPCAARASRPVTCVQRVLRAGIPRVVYAWNEPPTFVPDAAANPAAHELTAAGVELVQFPGLAPHAQVINSHLFH